MKGYKKYNIYSNESNCLNEGFFSKKQMLDNNKKHMVF